MVYRDRQIENQKTLDDLLNHLPVEAPVKLERVDIKEEVKEEEIIDTSWNEELNLSSDLPDVSEFVNCEANDARTISKRKSKRGQQNKRKSSENRKYGMKTLLENPVACSICGKEFSTKAYLKNHMFNVHSQTSAICQHCGKEFKSARYLDNHMLTHLTDEEKRFKCDRCPRKFYQKNLLLRHNRVSLITLILIIFDISHSIRSTTETNLLFATSAQSLSINLTP